ncbi:MAG: hypothetical protein RJA70_777 [Pseudomonadota bacterium]|jgi:hypothetical protein
MSTRFLSVGALLVAGGAVMSALVGCGPSMESDRVQSPEERLQEQERLQYEAELEAQKRGDNSEVEVAPDETVKFDKKGAKMELQRASLSARTCPKVVEGKHPQGTADFNITFRSDGSVKDATVAPPFDGGPLAECMLNAYRAVILKPFGEAEVTVPWQLELQASEPPAEPKPAPKKGAKK